jgi:hypothetical protein
MNRVTRDDRGAAALDRLLAAEREALFAGRYADLARFATQKAALVARLCTGTATRSRLVQVRLALLRQEQLLELAREGAGVARRQRAEGTALSTYGPDGASGITGPQGQRIARRF